MGSPLPLRPLGATGMAITRVGFGAWAIGGGGWAFSWSGQDDAESVAAIRHAVGRGVNWIDTAAVYGLGHSEEVVGRALREIPERERPLVFTKCGLVWDEQKRNAIPLRIGEARSLRRELEASLRRLGVERIDLYQMHRPAEDGTPVEQYWRTLLDLKAEGTARRPVATVQLDVAGRPARGDAQPAFSAIRREAANSTPGARRTHRDIVYSRCRRACSAARSPGAAERLPADDWRSRLRNSRASSYGETSTRCRRAGGRASPHDRGRRWRGRAWPA